MWREPLFARTPHQNSNFEKLEWKIKRCRLEQKNRLKMFITSFSCFHQPKGQERCVRVCVSGCGGANGWWWWNYCLRVRRAQTCERIITTLPPANGRVGRSLVYRHTHTHIDTRVTHKWGSSSSSSSRVGRNCRFVLAHAHPDKDVGVGAYTVHPPVSTAPFGNTSTLGRGVVRRGRTVMRSEAGEWRSSELSGREVSPFSPQLIILATSHAMPPQRYSPLSLFTPWPWTPFSG